MRQEQYLNLRFIPLFEELGRLGVGIRQASEEHHPGEGCE